MPEDVSGEKKALDVAGEMPVMEGTETDEELLLARDVMSGFIKAVKGYRFYPPDNPTLKGFRDQFVRKLHFFLNRHPVYLFQVGEYDFSYRGKVFYENRDLKTSLAFILYKDGLRELRFVRGVEDWEIDTLLELIKRSDHINQMEDDLVTLMWEKDYAHIGYVATDEFLDESPIAVPETVGQFRRNLVFNPVAHHVDADLGDEDAEDTLDLDKILARATAGPLPILLNKSVYSLTPEEVEGLRKEVEAEIDPTFVFHVVDTVFEIIALEKEREPYQNAVNVLEKILDGLLTIGEFRKASDLLKRIYITIKTYELKDWQVEIIQKLILDAGEPLRIERIGSVLESEEGIRLEDVSGYLVLLQKNSVKPLVQLLGNLKNSKTRRVFCDALSEIGKNAIDLFTPFIDDRRWYLVRNVTYILGRIGKEQAIPYIQKAYDHSETRVRREAVQALGFIGGTKAVGMLVKALSDADVRIRTVAAINLGKVGKKAGLVPLLEVVQSKDFAKKEPTEIKAFFDGIGMVGSGEAVPVLQQLLEKKGWFTRGKTDEIRVGAANALAMIGTPEAVAILESGRDAKDESLRAVCAQALSSRTAKQTRA